MCPRNPTPDRNRSGAVTRVEVLPSVPAKHHHPRRHPMQLENMKRDINLGAGGESRDGSAAGRSHLAGAVGGTVSGAPPRRRGVPLRRPGLAAVAALMLLPPCRLEFGADW